MHMRANECAEKDRCDLLNDRAPFAAQCGRREASKALNN